MFNCPSCSKETKRLIGNHEQKKVGCPDCMQEHKIMPCNLHEIVAQTSDGKHRVTRGKQSEIDNRTISRDDGLTVINMKTGREAQY